MNEYYFDHWQWRDLKWFVQERDWDGVEALIRSAEMRWYTLQVAQAYQVVDHKYK